MKLSTKLKGGLCLAAMATSLATGVSAQDKPVLAFIITNAQNPAEVGMRDGFVQKGEELGAEVRILNAEGSVEAMSNAIDDMIAQGVDGIATITMDSVVSMSWVDKTNEANIPYVSVAVQVGDPATTPFNQVYPGLSALIGQDYIVSGQRMAEAVFPLLPAGKKAKIGIVEGQPGYALVAQLNKGFSEKLTELGADFEIVFSQPTDWTPAKGQEVCSNGLIANPDIDIIFSHAEDMAIGCANAINDAGSQAKLVTAAGGSKLGTPLIKTGDIDISMCEAWIGTGALGAEALFQAATDPNTPKGRLVEYKPELITAENTDTVCPPQW